MLYAALITGVILTLAMGVANVAYKQSVLSTVGRDSQISFAMADSGIECGMELYLTSALMGTALDYTCGDTTILATAKKDQATPQNVIGYKLTPTLDTQAGLDPCFYVDIDILGEDVTMRSYGHNICDKDNARHLERALQVNF